MQQPPISDEEFLRDMRALTVSRMDQPTADQKLRRLSFVCLNVASLASFVLVIGWLWSMTLPPLDGRDLELSRVEVELMRYRANVSNIIIEADKSELWQERRQCRNEQFKGRCDSGFIIRGPDINYRCYPIRSQAGSCMGRILCRPNICDALK